MNSHKIINVANPTSEGDAASKAYVDRQIGFSKSGDTMTGILNMGSNKITNLQAPVDSKDAANKYYVDLNDRLRVKKAGDMMTGDLLLSVGTAQIRQLGCNDLGSGKTFALLLGNKDNSLQYDIKTDLKAQTPVTLHTTNGFAVKLNEDDLCIFTAASIVFNKMVFMNNKKITQLSDPEIDSDAATKYYVDEKCLSYDGHIPPMSANDTQMGFQATANASLDNKHQPYIAFAPHLLSLDGWIATIRQHAYLQIQCPSAVKIWKIRVRGRNDNANRITSWTLTAGNYKQRIHTLLESNVAIDNIAREFKIITNEAFAYYRITILNADSDNPGISHFQIFTKS
jgi:hypothetical protein